MVLGFDPVNNLRMLGFKTQIICVGRHGSIFTCVLEGAGLLGYDLVTLWVPSAYRAVGVGSCVQQRLLGKRDGDAS